jgi:protein-disulfide isomerase
MNKRLIVFVLAIIVAVAGFLWLTKPSDQTSGVNISNHTKGKGGKGVVLLEYGDFQCPGCAAYYPVVKELFNKYQADITFQFRNFPLEAIHTNARAASRAAEAANNQGKFWEMHDKLYENQRSWETTSDPLAEFSTYAQEIGITDLEKFKADYKSSAINNVINADIQAGQKLGVNSTPTFYLDGKKLDPLPQGQEAFNKLVEDAIANKGQAQQ